MRLACFSLPAILVAAGPALSAPAATRCPLGDVRTLEAAYETWKDRRPAGRGRGLVLPLGWSKAFSVEPSSARGRVEWDPGAGSLVVEVRGLPDSPHDFWLVDNRSGPGRSARPEPGDEMIRAGRLAREDGVSRLRADLPPGALAGFEIDLAVVTRGGETPDEGGVLFGAPTLFQRLAEGRGGRTLGDLVAQGEQLFFEETFSGNGRTCGTCHPAVNNFTLDPDFIGTLPADDPLFVAETDPDLAENFENPVLMRQFGLILENVDGFEDLDNKFTMRGVPHTFAQALSIAPSDFDSSGGGLVPPFERTGWSGDGAPGGGTLREFALGAIIQHFPRTLARADSSDFRFPTEPELDAIEAFLLSLGRQEELDLRSLELGDPEDRAGKALFITTGKCFACHSQAGANTDFVDPSGTLNVNFDTGVEDIDHPADPTGEPRPRDGGFGRDPHPQGGFGDGRFNTPSLVEAADTPPFFHHNVFATIEEAVAFYAGKDFNDSPAGTIVDGITLDEEQIRLIANFLRVVNALENIRSSSVLQARAIGAADVGRLLDVAEADIVDAIEVLSAKSLHSAAVIRLESARQLTAAAIDATDPVERDALIGESLAELEAARDFIGRLGAARVPGEGDSTKPVPPGEIAGSFRVHPNPAPGAREFSFETRREGSVTIEVFDVRGRRVATPFAGPLGAGPRTIAWSDHSAGGGSLARGVYFARLTKPEGTETIRFVVLDR